MIHGGLRYLRERRIRLTREAVRERERLLAAGTGLVDPLPFLYLNCEGDVSSPWLVGLGLTAYGLFGSGNHGHQAIAAEELQLFAPNLELEGVRGGYRYLDASTDDARLVFRVVREAELLGARAMNYVSAEGLLRDGGGRVRGVAVRDVVEGRSAEVRAGVVVNATGVYSGVSNGARSTLRPLRGSHLILPHEALPVTHAIAFAHPRDGRPVFACPWEGVTLVGTTDLDHPSLEIEPVATGEEVRYLFEAVRERFRDPPAASALLGTFAGVRPVISGGHHEPSREGREDAVWEDGGLVTVTGGKLTTFYPMARRVLELAGVRAGDGGALGTVPEALWRRAREELAPLPHVLRRRVAGRLGPDLEDFLRETSGEDLCRVTGTSYAWAELRWAAQHESVVHLDDLLLRRVRLGHLLPDGASALREELEGALRPLLGWSAQRWEKEWDRYYRLWRAHYGPWAVAG